MYEGDSENKIVTEKCLS